MSFARMIVVALATTLVAACSGPAPEDVASTEAAVWTVGYQYQGGAWNSGVAAGLSGWQEVNCLEDGYGFNGTATDLLNALTAWRERSSNLDNFVARLQAGCTSYVDVPANHRMEATGATVAHLVYSGGYRSNTGASTALGANLPIGIRIATNPGNDYVKDLGMLTGTTNTSAVTGNRFISGYSSPTFVGWALDYASYGNTQNLMCPDQMGLSGISLRNDTSSGKIRFIQLYCVELGDK